MFIINKIIYIVKSLFKKLMENFNNELILLQENELFSLQNEADLLRSLYKSIKYTSDLTINTLTSMHSLTFLSEHALTNVSESTQRTIYLTALEKKFKVNQEKQCIIKKNITLIQITFLCNTLKKLINSDNLSV